MFSKYHPIYQQIKGEVFDFFSSRLEASLIAFSLGLLSGFLITSYVWVLWGIFAGFGFFWIHRRNLKRSFLCLIVAFFCLGMTLVQLRLLWVKHPVLSEPLFHLSIEGEIEENLALPEKQILTLKNGHASFPFFQEFQKIQLVYQKTDPLFKRGDQIKAQVSLYPLTSLENIMGYQMPSFLYFKGFSARGEIHKIQHLIPTKTPPSLLEKIRQKVATDLFKILPENQARIAVPLIIGEQRFVSPSQYRLYRQAGIVHVLSVSGFHMALLAGFLFFLIRGICACFPYLTLHLNSKKLAALLSEIGTFFYLILSGAQIPALRSFGMISLVFLGVILDRPAFSKRSLFLIAFVLLLLQPENILSISFQLSFLSVLVLITTHEETQKKFHDKNKWVRRFVEFLLLNLTITLALMPLIAWHFNLINPYGVVGNLFLSALFSLLIMPCLFLAMMLMPFGMGQSFFLWAGTLLSWIEGFCTRISQLPFSEIMTPLFSPMGLIFFVYALIFFCTYHKIGKVLFGLLFMASLGCIYTTSFPQVLIYQNTYAWVQGGHFYQNASGQSFLLNRWQTQMGFQNVLRQDLPEALELKGKRIALKGSACAGASLALLAYPDARCHAPTVVLKPHTFYQVFIQPNEIILKEGKGISHHITS